MLQHGYSATREGCQILVLHILDHKSSTIYCMALMNIPYESLFLALQDAAPPVMSFCIIAEIWLHKEDHYQKYFRERTSLVLGVKI